MLILYPISYDAQYYAHVKDEHNLVAIKYLLIIANYGECSIRVY